MVNNITTALDLTAALFTLVYMAKLVFDSFLSSGEASDPTPKRSLLNQQVERRI